MVATKKNKAGEDVSKTPIRKGSDFSIDLGKIPNGNRKPLETCEFLQAMRDWRAKSAQSQMLIR